MLMFKKDFRNIKHHIMCFSIIDIKHLLILKMTEIGRYNTIKQINYIIITFLRTNLNFDISF